MRRVFVSILVVFTALVNAVPYTLKTETEDYSFKMKQGNEEVLWSGNESLEYIYVVGGYYSDDRGGYFPWGNTHYENVRFIGDTMGEIVIEYENGTEDTIPLIYGYTLWWNEQWRMASLPFKDNNGDNELTELLKQTLCLFGAFEGKPVCAFRIAVDNTVPIAKIKRVDNDEKTGHCEILGIHTFSSPPTDNLTGSTYKISSNDPFYDTHTIDSKNPLPEDKKDALKTLCLAIATDASDWENPPEFTYPDDYIGPEIYFSGSPYANIANGVISTTVTDLRTRAQENGYFPESLPYTEQYLLEDLERILWAQRITN